MTKPIIRGLLLLLPVGAVLLQWWAWKAVGARGKDAQRHALASPPPGLFPELSRQLWREVDPQRRQLLLARAWLQVALNPERLTQLLSPRQAMEEAAQLPQKLDRARQMAQQALLRRPANGQAAAVVAALAYQEAAWSGQRTDGPGPWERPLDLALRLNPDDPDTLLVAALITLDRYPSLASQERSKARALFQRVMDNPKAFAFLLPRWSEQAEDLPTWLSVIPQRSWAFRQLAAKARSAQEVTLFCQLQDKANQLLWQELEKQVDSAERWLASGNPHRARQELLAALAKVPAEAHSASLLTRALALLPPGPWAASLAPQARAWVRLASWFSIAGKQLLPPLAVERLALALPSSDLPLRACAHLLAGNHQDAQLLEHQAETLNTEPWALYLLLKAHRLLREQKGKEAQELLRLLPWWAQNLPSTRQLVAQAQGRGASADLSSALPCQFGVLEPSCSRLSEGRWEVEFFVPRGQAQLAVRWDPAGAAQAAVELFLDGAAQGCFPALGGAVTRLPVPVSAGIHRLEVTLLWGQPQPMHITLTPLSP